MANTTPAVVTQVTGRAFIRNADGSLTELHVGSHVPPNSEVVTASGGTVALQVDGGMPLVIGENRDVAFNADMAGQPADPQESALAAPTGTDSDRLLAALQNGQDPFDNLDPTAALVAGGGDAGGSSFVRLARILESTSPLGLAYPNDGPAAFNNLINSAGIANNNNGATNDAPLAGDDANTTTERSVVFGNILTNDTDPNNDALAIVSVGDRPMATGGVSVAGSTGGTFTVFPDGSYVFNPGDGYHNLGAGQSTTSTATYTVTDPSGATSTATITVTVNGVNDAPTSTAIANVTGTDAEKGVNVDVSTHFTDVDNGDKLTFTATGLPPGLVIDPATGKITGTIDHSASQGGDNGHYQVVVTATDASGATSSQTFDWDVTNPGPTATNDAGATNEGATLSVTDPAQGVLANDSDVDGDKLSVTHVVGQPGSEGDAGVAVTGTNGGTFTINADGTYTFTPGETFEKLAEGEKATTSVTYTVSDGEGGTTTATLEVTVTGTNDVPVITPHEPTSPEDPLQGDHGTVVEDTQLSVQGKLDIVDADHDQSFFRTQTNTAGDHGTFSIDADGKWAYNLNNTDTAVQSLAVGEHLTETFTVVTADGTTTQVVVTIDGTNDNPVIHAETGADAGSVIEDTKTSVTGQLTQTDVDTSDTHTWSVSGSSQGAYGSLTVDNDGKWTYNLDHEATQALAAGETKTEKFTVQVSDNNGGTDTHVVEITITGTNDTPVITPHEPTSPQDPLQGDHGTVVEDTQLSVEGKLDIVDADHDQSSFQAQTGTTGAHGTFSIDANGKWTYNLDNNSDAVQHLAVNEHLTDTFTVVTADGTTTQVVITIDGTNDDPKITGEHTGTLTEDAAPSVSGQLGVSDVDTNDTHTWTIDGTDQGKYGSLVLDQNGKWTYNADPAKIQALAQGEKADETFTVKVDDHHGGTTTQTVTITLTGTNDTPIITPHDPVDPSNPLAGDKGTVVEDKTLSVDGKIDIVDADHDQSSFQAQTDTNGAHGTFSIDANGKWTYNLDNNSDAVQHLAVNEHLTDTFTVVTADGTTTQVVITIDGTNDDPKITGEHTGTLTEDVANTVSGQLGVSDVDTSDTHTWTIDGTDQGKYGSLVLDQNGKWTYNADPAKIQALAQGEKADETFTVKVDDHHGGTTTQTVTITLTGTNDTPIITPHDPVDPSNPLAGDKGTVVEDKTLSVDGKIDIADADHDQSSFQAQTDTNGAHGTFSIDANGKWTYNLDNNSDAVQQLAVNEHLTDTFTVVTADGTTTQVVITIDGTNDDPKITGEHTGALTEDVANTVSGQLGVSDVDTSDTHTWTIDGTDQGKYGSLVLDQNGKWTYNADPAKIQALAQGEKADETFTVKVDDHHGGTTTQTVTITLTGTNDTPIITPHDPVDPANPSAGDKGLVIEDDKQSVSGKIDIADADHDQSAFVAQTGKEGTYGTFNIGTDGTWSYQLHNGDVQFLAAGEHRTETFDIFTADGTKTQVVITIDGTNDKPQISGAHSADVTEGGDTSVSGQLGVSDVDTSDTHTWSIDGTDQGKYGSLVLDQNGKWTYNVDQAKIQTLGQGEKAQDTFTVKVDDHHGGTTTEIVTINLTGVEHGAIVTGNGAGTVQEDHTTTATGKLNVTDPDPGQAVFQAQTDAQGQYGKFSIDADGNWTYKLANDDLKVQHLAANDTVTEQFTVTTADGTTSTVTITINGDNDTPTITGPSTGNVKEDGTQTTGGQLAVSDLDTHDTHSWSIDGSATGNYGSLTLSADGKWTYTLDNAKAQALTNADSKTETFTVKVDDHHGGTDTQTITVTVKGTDDGATISGNGTGSVTEDQTTTSTGKLTVTDPDAGQAVFQTQTDAQGQYGKFSIDADGNWTYKLSNDQANVQALSGNDHKTETFTVTSADGTTSTVTVDVNGTNDAPTATDNATTVNVGQTHTFTSAEFNFADSHGEHDSLQSVIITHLPDNGTLTFNGQPVTANQVISQADIDAGKLVFTPASSGAHDTDFGFKVVDNGGTDHAGQNTSTDHTFSINTGNITTGNNDGTPINGGHGDDVLVGDQGGVKTTTTPGQNYNIALIVDHSGSMSAKIDGTTRMQLVKDALTQFVKQLAGHDGIVNVTLIGFGDKGDTPVTIQNLNLSDVDQATDTLMKAITALKADGATNYEDAFNDAKSWFDSQASAHKGTGDGYQNLSFFMTDGDPTVYGTKGQSGQGDSTDQDTLQHSVDAFSGLSNVSTVYGIGIGDGVNTNLLQFFDNTNVTGTHTVVYGTKDTNLTSSSSYNFDSTNSWHQVTGGNASAGSVSDGGIFSSAIVIKDTYGANGTNNANATIVDSNTVTVAAGTTAHFTFDLDTSIRSGDTFSWALQELVNGQWVTVDSGTKAGSITTKEVDGGQYRFEFQLDDNTSSGSASLTIDHFHMISPDGVTGNVGQVDIVHQASDLNAALNGGSTHSDPAPVGNDTINGGDGNDIIFGDTINTDALAWTGHAAGSHNGAGMQGLVDYLTATNGHAPTSTDLYSYISQHSDQFNVAGDTRGGNDVIHGGAGNDIIYGQGGSDTIVGGQGDDKLYGGEGSDTFKWELNDQGSVGHAAVDTIKDFSNAAPAAGGDILHLSELLHNPANNDLSQYLKFSKVGTNTEIQVSTTGHVASGYDQKIVLENVDLVGTHGNDQAAIIQDLIQKGKLQGGHN